MFFLLLLLLIRWWCCFRERVNVGWCWVTAWLWVFTIYKEKKRVKWCNIMRQTEIQWSVSKGSSGNLHTMFLAKQSHCRETIKIEWIEKKRNTAKRRQQKGSNDQDQGKQEWEQKFEKTSEVSWTLLRVLSFFHHIMTKRKSRNNPISWQNSREERRITKETESWTNHEESIFAHFCLLFVKERSRPDFGTTSRFLSSSTMIVLEIKECTRHTSCCDSAADMLLQKFVSEVSRTVLLEWKHRKPNRQLQ
jgi:hypothetical protein